jgi:hypothetical protein
MDRHAHRYCVPRLDDPLVPREPFVDLQSGYILRAIATFPKQGPAPPWRGYQSYPRDLRYIGRADLADGVLQFERGDRAVDAAPIAAAA